MTRSKISTLKKALIACFCFLPLACIYSCRQSSKKIDGTARVHTPIPALPLVENIAQTNAPPDIRVAVLKDQQTLRISGGKARRINNSAGILLQNIPDESVIQISLNSSGLVLNGKALPDTKLTIQSANANDAMLVNDQEVGARLMIYRPGASSGMSVVAAYDLEEYLAGVLAGEVPYERWHAEALRAQAITSRTYALNQMKRNASDPYDVESTVMSQVFKAGYRNNAILNSATAATRGLALTNGGASFAAYFHSTCGDHTESSAGVFPDQTPVRPLSGAPCGFCAQSPAHRWTYQLNKSALEQKLRAQSSASAAKPGARPGAPVGRIERIEFLDASGTLVAPMTRVAQVRIHHSNGVLPMQGNQFRLLAGARDLKSLLFEQVIDRGESIEISGAGYGHGVGLCQWGSQGMALAGYTHAQILGKYYAGAALTKMY